MTKRILKRLSIVLSVLLFIGNSYPAFAYDLKNGNSIENVEYQNTKEKDFTDEISVYAELASIYKVTIPKIIVLSGAEKKASYVVKVEGDIAGYEAISAIPDENFILSSKNKNGEIAIINQNKTQWRYNDFSINANGTITAEGITAGKWQGIFNFNLEINKVAGDVIAPEHKHEWVFSQNVLLPTCTEKGTDEYICNECKRTKLIEVDATGHNAGDFKTEQNPTCTETGLDVQRCTVCGEILETKIIPALGHNYVDGTCIRCGDALPNLTVTASGFTGTYDGNPHSASIISEENTILYSTDNINFTETNPSFTDTGTYTVYYKVSKVPFKTLYGQTNVIIEKAKSNIENIPTKKKLSYNTNSQILINAGTAINGTIKYSLDGNNFSESLPSATNAGTYTVYYKVFGNKNYSDTEVNTIIVQIDKIDNSFKIGTNQGAVRKSDRITTTVITNKSGGQIEVTSTNANIATGSVNGNAITINGIGLGSCDVIITAKETTNYKAASIVYPVVVSNTILNVNPNGGTYNGSSDIVTFGVDEGKSYTKSFSYTGNVQEFTVPYTGFYFIEAWGASGGDDVSDGGKGGYVKTYSYLTKDTKLYIAVGGKGNSGRSRGAGWNGGANAGGAGKNDPYVGGCPGASGGGGGATHIATTNRGVLANYANYKNEVITVAGGGSGGSAYSTGEGGTVLYAYTESNKTFPGAVINGASTARLNGAFANGTYPGDAADGGGGGGGWVGGKGGLDTAGNPAGGGASFVNTNAGCIPIELVPSNNLGNGKVTITFEQRSVNINDPVRSGYKFAGWQLTGSGTQKTNTLGKTTMFNFVTGTTSTLTAKWTKQ